MLNIFLPYVILCKVMHRILQELTSITLPSNVKIKAIDYGMNFAIS